MKVNQGFHALVVRTLVVTCLGQGACGAGHEDKAGSTVARTWPEIRRTGRGDKFEEISLEKDADEDERRHNETITMAGETKEMIMMDKEQIMNDMGVWSFDHQDFGVGDASKSSDNSSNRPLHQPVSSVKIIPDEHHVSAYLNKGIVKRFLFLNDKFGNPLSITITPCTSILWWVVKFWPLRGSTVGSPEHVKTYRTQRAVTYTESVARRGVYSVDLKAVTWDSYVHIYATSYHSEPIKVYSNKDSSAQRNLKRQRVYSDNRDKFYQHVFTHADEIYVKGKRDMGSHGALGVHKRPRIWVRRLRGNRLHVKWDVSPVNPHLMSYCIVVNTKRDYNSLCSASGERFGVLPPDLLHVTYYDSTSDLISKDATKGNSESYESRKSSETSSTHAKRSHRRLNRKDSRKARSHLKHRHSLTSLRRRAGRERRRISNNGQGKDKSKDLMIGCLNRKTSYVLGNLRPGKLYYFNVFIRDSSTNVSFPYVRTTLQYKHTKSTPNTLRNGKPKKVKLPVNKGARQSKPLTLKFKLKKPCNSLTIYAIPCGGGSITYEVLHENRTIYTSPNVDMMDIIKIAMPQRGRYFINIMGEARMVEMFVSKRNKKLPLPKLPAITKITQDESRSTCDSVTLQWWPALDPRDNEYCIFFKEERRSRIFNFKKPNQCDVERSLKSDPYVTQSYCLQEDVTDKTMLISKQFGGLQPNTKYVIHLIIRRHNGKSLSYDQTLVRTMANC